MAGVSGSLSWQDVKEWLEKQEPYLLQAVLKTTTNLLGTQCNNSEDMAASEDAKDDTLEDQEEKEKVEAEAREWEETANNGKKTESNKVALADVDETVLEAEMEKAASMASALVLFFPQAVLIFGLCAISLKLEYPGQVVA